MLERQAIVEEEMMKETVEDTEEPKQPEEAEAAVVQEHDPKYSASINTDKKEEPLTLIVPEKNEELTQEVNS